MCASMLDVSVFLVDDASVGYPMLSVDTEISAQQSNLPIWSVDNAGNEDDGN